MGSTTRARSPKRSSVQLLVKEDRWNSAAAKLCEPLWELAACWFL